MKWLDMIAMELWKWYKSHSGNPNAHHTKYTNSNATGAMGTKGDDNPFHHDRYTDGEVDTIVATHTTVDDAHHTKYTDANAVSALATVDNYVKNDANDLTTGTFECTEKSLIKQKSGVDYFYQDFKDENNVLLYRISVKKTATDNYFFYYDQTNLKVIWMWKGNRIRLYNNIIRDPKNHAASALSGTKKLVEIDIGGTSYYFEVYPTKA